MKLIHIILLAMAVGIILYFFLTKDTTEPQPIVTSYEECVANGYVILDSYPEQCETPDGQLFTREIRPHEVSLDILAHIESKQDLIKVAEPTPLGVVSSPLTVRGEARGVWFFEADFPVTLIDGNGNDLARWYASAVLDPNNPESTWMTEDFVTFEGEIHFSTPTTPDGTLIFSKDNPSGLPEYDDELRIPVRFSSEVSMPEQTIQLYFYDPALDTDADGNIMCSERGLVAVERTIPLTQTPVQYAVNLLLSGDMTPQEEAGGLTSEYPLAGVMLSSVRRDSDGTLVLALNDPNNATSGGSCRSGILWLQIERTAQQFDGVDVVRFEPEDLFQP
jgi:hypothetical protein